MRPKNYILGLVIMALLIGSFLYYMFSIYYYSKKRHEKNLAYDFKDTVKAIQYDFKATPQVMIAGKSYYLNDGYNFNYKIAVGDSLIKLKGQTTYKLVKKRSGVVFLFDKI